MYWNAFSYIEITNVVMFFFLTDNYFRSLYRYDPHAIGTYCVLCYANFAVSYVLHQLHWPNILISASSVERKAAVTIPLKLRKNMFSSTKEIKPRGSQSVNRNKDILRSQLTAFRWWRLKVSDSSGSEAIDKYGVRSELLKQVVK